jgi:hypothetical protein
MLDVRYTSHFLNKLEDIFAESDYILRYEKGNFKSGYCVLKSTKVIMVNTFYPLEGKINCLLEILRTLPLQTENFSDKNRKFFLQIIGNQHAEKEAIEEITTSDQIE